jgi:hypothetical protein
MFPLLQQSGVANRWQRPDLTVTRRRRLRPLAHSLLSAVPSNGPTQLNTPLANPGLGKHHTRAYPRTKSDTDAVTLGQCFGCRIELEPGSGSRKAQGCFKELRSQWAKSIGQGGLPDVLQNKRRAWCAACSLHRALQRGEILAQWPSAILRIGQAIRAPLDEPQRWIRGARANLR